MSTDASTSKDIPGRIMTRQKAAQLKRQLQSEPPQQSPITKSNKTDTPNSTKKTITHSEKSDIKTEFHPEKLKRKATSKKVFLKPKHEMKPIVNKRKFGLPQKDKYSSLAMMFKQQTATGVSKHELIQLKDERGLDEDEFLEILTCESPVWWEDPPSSNEMSKEDIAEPLYGIVSENLLQHNKNSADVQVHVDPKQDDKNKRNDNGPESFVDEDSSMDSDVTFDEEMINALENSYIPIENTSTTEDVIVLDDSSQDTVQSYKHSKFETIKIKKPDESEETYYLEDVTLTVNSPDKSEYTKKIEESKATSSFAITSIEKESISSPITIKSDDSIDDDNVVSDQANNEGTISDALIRYIDKKVQSNDDCEKVDQNLSNQNEDLVKDTKEELPHDSKIDENEELVCVYKVISGEDNKNIKDTSACNETSSDKITIEGLNAANKKLDSYFKKCKRGPTIKPENHNDKFLDSKSSLLSAESKKNLKPYVTIHASEIIAKIPSGVKNIKYCLRCSSLFQSNTCGHKCHVKRVTRRDKST